MPKEYGMSKKSRKGRKTVFVWCAIIHNSASKKDIPVVFGLEKPESTWTTFWLEERGCELVKVEMFPDAAARLEKDTKHELDSLLE